MAIPTPQQTIIDPTGDTTLIRNEVAVATANGGVFVFETSKDIYVTAVQDEYTNQYVNNQTQEITNVYANYDITNNISNVANGIQYNVNGNFTAQNNFTYNSTTEILNVPNIAADSVSSNSVNSASIIGTLFGNVVISANNTANLGAVANVKIYNGSLNQFLRSTGNGNIDWAFPAVIISNEFHVATNGNNTTGDGTQGNPFATIGNAIARVGATTGYKVIVHAGTYTENVTISTTNTTLVAAQSDVGASPLINGNLIISGSATAVKVQGISANYITVNTTGTSYFTQTKAANGVNKTGSGYMEVVDSDWAVAGGNALFNAGTSVTNGTKLANVQVQGTGIINIKNSIQVSNVIANGAGAVVSIDDSYVYAPSVGANAVQVINGALTARSSLFLEPDLTPARIGITTGFLGYDDISFDKANSTLGAGLNATAYFQDIDAENITASGNITIGSGVLAPDSDNLEVRGYDNFNVEVDGVVNIYTDASGTTYQWQFGDDGALTVPGSIITPFNISIGNDAGTTNQGNGAIAIGSGAAANDQGIGAVAIGGIAGETSQGITAIAVGYSAGGNNQSTNSIAIGNAAGQSNLAAAATAIGLNAGFSNTSSNSIYLGANAGANGGSFANVIVLNSAGTALNPERGNATYISSVRNDTSNIANAVYYNAATKELTYAPPAVGANIVNGNSNVTVTANGNVTVSSAGNSNIFTVTGTGANVAGTANVTGNANVGGILTVTGNAGISGNLTVTTNANLQGQTTIANLQATVSANADTVSGNLVTLTINGVAYQLLAR